MNPNCTILIKGSPIDDQTHCIHYHTSLDIIAIKFKYCNDYYPCHYCHQEKTDHATDTWKQNEHNTKAVLCGQCKHELTIQEYLNSNNQFPQCNAEFNPKCCSHYPFYFEI